MTDDSIWVWKCFHLHKFSPQDQDKIILSDKFDKTLGQLLHIVSDASVHIAAGKVTGASHRFGLCNAKQQVV
jgi:hypothetical protein